MFILNNKVVDRTNSNLGDLFNQTKNITSFSEGNLKHSNKMHSNLFC